jgi:uncharacterized small protein (DUF1192 family)
MKIEIDDDAIDNLVVSALSESIGHIQNEIKLLKKTKNLKPHQKQDLEDLVLDLDGLTRARYYFGGEKYWPKK